jgi:hypothetical protein
MGTLPMKTDELPPTSQRVSGRSVFISKVQAGEPMTGFEPVAC